MNSKIIFYLKFIITLIAISIVITIIVNIYFNIYYKSNIAIFKGDVIGTTINQYQLYNTLKVDHDEINKQYELFSLQKKIKKCPNPIVEGKYGKGILLDDCNTLVINDFKEYNFSKSSIEMWIKPVWEKNYNFPRYFFDEGVDKEHNRISFYVSENNFLIFRMYESDGTNHIIQENISNWKINEWYHIAATWDLTKGEILLYIDGNLKDSTTVMDLNLTKINTKRFYFGSDIENKNQAFAVVDNLLFYIRVLEEAEIRRHMFLG